MQILSPEPTVLQMNYVLHAKMDLKESNIGKKPQVYR